MSAIGRPAATAEFAPFYADYIARVPGEDPLAVLEAQAGDLAAALAAAPADKETYRYAPGKWSVREVVGHLIDAERIMVYRALAIARGDQTPLPGFEEDAYNAQGGFDAIPLRELADELAVVRQATLLFLHHLPAEAWRRIGTANEHAVSVRALAFIVAGHARHHLAILAERYGVEAAAAPA